MRKSSAPSRGQGTHAQTIITRARELFKHIEGTPHEGDLAILALPLGMFAVLLIEMAVKSWI